MKTKFLTLGCFFALSSLYGQTAGPAAAVPTVIPSSPNTAAFEKYGNIPVSAYTGVPDITIPLYEIKVRDISIPVTLSYHASGIKVADEASRVGLGWVLNCGGVVSRNIIGLDDFFDDPRGYLSPTNTSPSIPKGTQNSPTLNTFPGSTYLYRSSVGYGATQSLSLGKDKVSNGYDFQPDQYNYNFNGRSGKFVLDRTRKVLLMKQEKIRIRVIGAHGDSWEITTPDGFKYKFAAIETCTDNDGIVHSAQRTAWYLTEIISPQNEHVHFYYETEGTQDIQPVGSYYEMQAQYSFTQVCDRFNCINPSSVSRPVSGKLYNNIYLSRVEWSTGSLRFNVANDRKDLKNDVCITSMDVFSNSNETGRNAEVVFTQTYSVSDSTPFPYTFSTNDFYYARRRLVLKGVTKKSIPDLASHQPEVYLLGYNSTKLPPKNSFARDHWGYYNGKSNTSLIPAITNFVSGQDPTSLPGVIGNQRDPDPSFAVAGSLYSITYPTKGSTKFFFESNTFDQGRAPITNQGAETAEPYQFTTRLFNDGRTNGTPQTGILNLTNEYIKEGKALGTYMTAAFRTTGKCKDLNYAPDVYCELFDPNGLSVIRTTLQGVICSTSDGLTCIYCDRSPLSQSPVFQYQAQLRPLAPGIYTLKTFINGSEKNIEDISVNFTWWVDALKQPKEIPGTNNQYAYVGGLRVQSIQSFDPERSSDAYEEKSYDYHYKTDADSNGILEEHSYGRRMVAPSYSYFNLSAQFFDYNPAPITYSCPDCITLAYSSDSAIPLAGADGNSIGYDRVREFRGTKEKNAGFTDFEFHNLEDVFNPYPTEHNIKLRPPSVATSSYPLNGLLKTKTLYNRFGLAVHRTENEYVCTNDTIIYGIDFRLTPKDQNFVSSGDALGYQLNYPSMHSTFPHLESTKEIDYLDGDTISTVQLTQFTYSTSHYQVIQKTKAESDQSVTTVSTMYPLDFDDDHSTPSMRAMKGESFMHALPVETETSIVSNSKYVIADRQFTVYDTANGTFIMPKSKYELIKHGPGLSIPDYDPTASISPDLYSKLFDIAYNSDNNISRVQKKNDVPVAYLWGYNHTLPVAEIKNAETRDCFFTSFEDDGDYFLDSDSVTLARTGRKVLSSSGFSFPLTFHPADSTMLVMSYWYWASNKWNFSGIVPFTSSISTSGTKLDEIRAYPKGSQMSSYTYVPNFGITSQTDASSVTTYYEYDDMKRLKAIRDRDGKVLKTYAYRLKP